MDATVYIIGAGIAGLSAAVSLIGSGRRVIVYETGPRAGGRCRSFFDATLDRVIDNGSHLVLSGNHALLSYAQRIGAMDHLMVLRPAMFPFHDLRDGRRWALRPGGLWLLDPARRVPDTRLGDYLSALKTLLAGVQVTAGAVFPAGTVLYDRLWRTLIVSILNGAPERVSARLFGAVLRETLLKGEGACRPVLAPQGLAAAFVDPAVAFLARHGTQVRVATRVDAIVDDGMRITALSVGGRTVTLGSADAVILAVPPQRAAALLPWLSVPAPGPAIVNAHFRLETAAAMEAMPFLGLIGGTAEWLFQRGDVLSATVSNADALAACPAAEVAARLWADVSGALGLEAAPVPAVRVIKEKRATFDQTPDSAGRRPSARTRFPNLILAGDWTRTGLPATLEGAARSGATAAAIVGR